MKIESKLGYYTGILSFPLVILIMIGSIIEAIIDQGELTIGNSLLSLWVMWIIIQLVFNAPDCLKGIDKILQCGDK